MEKNKFTAQTSSSKRISLHEYRKRSNTIQEDTTTIRRRLSTWGGNCSTNRNISLNDKLSGNHHMSHSSFTSTSTKKFFPSYENFNRQKTERMKLQPEKEVQKNKEIKSNDEPVILTLSSSDEENEENENNCKGNDSEPICSKEPPRLAFTEKNQYIEPAASNDYKLGALSPRIIRIGSYKFMTTEEILILHNIIRLHVPGIHQDSVSILNIPVCGILKVLANFEGAEPILFIYVYPDTAEDIRKSLCMKDKDSYYIDPLSEEESHRRVTFVLNKIDNYTKGILFKIFTNKGRSVPFFEEITAKEAETILIKSSGSHAQAILKSQQPSLTETFSNKTILVYPPPPSKGRITITVDDYACLAKEQFLNDVIIDFYLKWLHLSKLPDIHRQRTHIFSTFFYKRLTSKPKKSNRNHIVEDPKLTASEKRHARVQSWSKGIDIFEKDFIFVPINEKSHWFLAVICFPGLETPVRISDGQAIPVSEASLLRRTSRPHSIKNPSQPDITDAEHSDRDEAEGDESELENYEEADEPPLKRLKEEEEIPLISDGLNKKVTPSLIKQPCILIFDSLAGSSRSRIVSTLREYLYEEYKKRKGKSREFSRLTMQGACPKVPQQMNYSDCGIFTLQYAESFFEKPIKDYTLPIRSIVDWFDMKIVEGKRQNIASLIKCLMEKETANHAISNKILPDLNPAKLISQEKSQSESRTESHFSIPKHPTSVSQESSGLDTYELKPITDVQPFKSKKIKLKMSDKNMTNNKEPSQTPEDDNSLVSEIPINNDTSINRETQKNEMEFSNSLSLLSQYNSDMESEDSKESDKDVASSNSKVLSTLYDDCSSDEEDNKPPSQRNCSVIMKISDTISSVSKTIFGNNS